MLLRLALDYPTSCLSLPSAGTPGVHNHAYLQCMLLKSWTMLTSLPPWCWYLLTVFFRSTCNLSGCCYKAFVTASLSASLSSVFSGTSVYLSTCDWILVCESTLENQSNDALCQLPRIIRVNGHVA